MSGFQKNVAGQRWSVFAFDRTTNDPITGDAANITAKIRKDYAAASATNDVNPTEIEDGYYEFTLTQAESNADVLDLFPESSTGDVQVIGSPARVFTVPPNFNTLGITAGSIDNVTLTDTTTLNSDMRGTDGANTVAPATPTNVTDAQTAIVAEVNANEVKIDGIKTKTDQMVFTNPNEIDANAVSGGGGGDATAANQASITADIAALAATGGAGPWTSGGSAIGAGSESVTVLVESGGIPVSSVEVWVTTDLAGVNVIAGTLYTDSFGNVLFMLDPGTYYVWRKSDTHEFPNPVTLVVP